MILSINEAQGTIGYEHFDFTDGQWERVVKIMKEVEQRTAEETRDKICNKLDDWVQGIVYDDSRPVIGIDDGGSGGRVSEWGTQ